MRKRTIREDDDNSEDRGLDRVVSFLDKFSKKPSKQPEVDRLFKWFNLADHSNLLETKPFPDWAGLVTDMYKKNPEASEMVIASTLTTKLGDNSLAK